MWTTTGQENRHFVAKASNYPPWFSCEISRIDRNINEKFNLSFLILQLLDCMEMVVRGRCVCWHESLWVRYSSRSMSFDNFEILTCLGHYMILPDCVGWVSEWYGLVPLKLFHSKLYRNAEKTWDKQRFVEIYFIRTFVYEFNQID